MTRVSNFLWHSTIRADSFLVRKPHPTRRHCGAYGCSTPCAVWIPIGSESWNLVSSLSDLIPTNPLPLTSCESSSELIPWVPIARPEFVECFHWWHVSHHKALTFSGDLQEMDRSTLLASSSVPLPSLTNPCKAPQMEESECSFPGEFLTRPLSICWCIAYI